VCNCLSDQGAPDAVFLRAMPHNEEALIPMQPTGRCGALACRQADLPWDDGNANTRYAFKVLHGRRQTWLAADGMHPHPPAESMLFRVSRHTPPAWVRDQVFYQVFPDRFDRAAPSRDRRGEQVFGTRTLPVLQPAWGAPLDPSQAQNTFYGGDLDGIARRLDRVQHALARRPCPLPQPDLRPRAADDRRGQSQRRSGRGDTGGGAAAGGTAVDVASGSRLDSRRSCRTQHACRSRTNELRPKQAGRALCRGRLEHHESAHSLRS
jgi:hypothetical protein